MNTDLRKKGFPKVMNNSLFGKTMEKVRKYGDINLVPTVRRRSYLVSKPNFRVTRSFTENLLAIGMRTTETLMNKLHLNKILMYEFWYDYVKPRYDEKAKLCYMDTDSFI